MFKEIDLAWAAGFFDGEGCVILRKVKNTYAVRIAVSQVNPTPIKRFKDMFGGHISYQKSKNPNWSAQWKWEQDSKSASETLRLLQPYLCVKHDVVALALEFQKLKRKGRRASATEIELEESFKSKISILNRKD